MAGRQARPLVAQDHQIEGSHACMVQSLAAYLRSNNTHPCTVRGSAPPRMVSPSPSGLSGHSGLQRVSHLVKLLPIRDHSSDQAT